MEFEPVVPATGSALPPLVVEPSPAMVQALAELERRRSSALASFDTPSPLLPGWGWPMAESDEPTPIFDELTEETFVGWQILPVRNSAADPVADDYLSWSSVTEAPWFRGGREQTIAAWRRNAPHEITDARFAQLFADADAFGTSARGLGDHWGDRIMCMEVPGGPGLLPRDRLREFANVTFPNNQWAPDAERIAALLEPFEPDPDDTRED